jgi:peptidoglycan hydrolase CwlO-like protein
METPQTRLSPLEKVQLQIKTLQNKVVFLTEENKQLKQTIKELKRTTRPSRSSVNRDRIDTA